MKYTQSFRRQQYKPMLRPSEVRVIGYHQRFDPLQNAKTLLTDDNLLTSFFHADPANHLPFEQYYNMRPYEEIYQKSVLNGVSSDQFIVHAPYNMNISNYQYHINQWARARFLYEAHCTRVCGQKYLNIHCGSVHKTDWKDMNDCYKQIADNINFVLNMVPDVTILLETMCNSKSVHIVGSSFEELAQIYEMVKQKERVGITIDSAHCWEGAFVPEQNYAENLLSSFQKHFKMEKLKCLHLNNSLTPYGSNNDRHEAIKDGKGTIPNEELKKLVQMTKCAIVMEIAVVEGQIELVREWAQ
ncbi:Endonuclease_IV [Hexamita inflata]|uniref:Endonuclease IV n=1 Tax=Hexamita inflata TaxID=28002 RepID=A0AA86NR27_9EUKA|nr:Endonuclease IV [Hexamita inflata]